MHTINGATQKLEQFGRDLGIDDMKVVEKPKDDIDRGGYYINWLNGKGLWNPILLGRTTKEARVELKKKVTEGEITNNGEVNYWHSQAKIPIASPKPPEVFMKVDRKQLVDIFQEVGWHNAPSWANDDEKVLTKIRALPRNVDPENKIEDKALQAVLDEILEALKKDENAEFEITGEFQKPEKIKAPKPEKEEKVEKTKSKKDKGEKKGKKDAAERDKFGARLGTRAATINALMTKKPQTVAEITKASKCKAVYSHLRYLEEKGFVVKSDKGFALKK